MNLVVIKKEKNYGNNYAELHQAYENVCVRDVNILSIVNFAKNNNFHKIFYITNNFDYEINKHLNSQSFEVPVKVIQNTSNEILMNLFVLSPIICRDPFLLLTEDAVFNEQLISGFINYLKNEDDLDGAFALTKHFQNNNSICVAMDDDDTILKFSESSDGYSWATSGIYFFSTQIFREMDFALNNGVLQFQQYLKNLIARNYYFKGYVFQ